MAAVKRANDAYGRKDWPGFLDGARAASRLSPENPDLRFRVARALVLDGKTADGLAELERLADMRLVYPVEEHPDLEAARAEPAFRAVVEKMAASAAPIDGGLPGWTFPGDMLVEAVAFDPATKSWFVSSIHQGKVMKIVDGRVEDHLVLEQDGAMGMAWDAARNALWVGVAALPQAKGFSEGAEGRSAVLLVEDGRITRRFELPGRHVFGDLALRPGGELWVSDSLGGGIYRLAGEKLEAVIAPGTLRSPQGLTFTPDGRSAYVADYALGVFRLDPERRTVTALEHAGDVCVYGIDGLLLHGGGLLAMQNGTRPHRLVRLVLDGSGARIERAEILDRNDSVVEPTNGVLAGDTLHYVSTSQWASFGGGPVESRPPALIRKVVVGPAAR